MALLVGVLLLVCGAPARAQTAPAASAAAPTLPPPTLPPVPKHVGLESAGPTAASPKRLDDTGLPATARSLTGDVPLGGKRLREAVKLPPLTWDEHKWARFRAVDAVTSGVFAAAGIAAAILPPIKSDRRSGPILFDKAARNFFKIDDTSGRFSARDASDAILSILITYPVFIDSVATAWWLRGNADVARQIALIDLEAMAITVGTQGITNVIVARERPYGVDCGTAIPGDINDCTRNRRYRSTFSGHTSQAFTAAGLMCYHHMKLRLLGDGPGDALTCASGLVAATAVGTLRMAGDMHYASDVMIGAGVGTLIGLGVPFLHYHGLPTLSVTGKTGTTTASVVPSGMGLAVVGTF